LKAVSISNFSGQIEVCFEIPKIVKFNSKRKEKIKQALDFAPIYSINSGS
jgi:hypothetical protein